MLNRLWYKLTPAASAPLATTKPPSRTVPQQRQPQTSTSTTAAEHDNVSPDHAPSIGINDPDIQDYMRYHRERELNDLRYRQRVQRGSGSGSSRSPECRTSTGRERSPIRSHLSRSRSPLQRDRTRDWTASSPEHRRQTQLSADREVTVTKDGQT